MNRFLLFVKKKKEVKYCSGRNMYHWAE